MACDNERENKRMVNFRGDVPRGTIRAEKYIYFGHKLVKERKLDTVKCVESDTLKSKG